MQSKATVNDSDIAIFPKLHVKTWRLFDSIIIIASVKYLNYTKKYSKWYAHYPKI